MCDRLSFMDVLTDLLERSRARGAAFSLSTIGGDWGIRFSSNNGLAVHVIVDGELFSWVDDPSQAQRLVGGDVILVRSSTPNYLASAPGADCIAWAEFRAGAEATGRKLRGGDATSPKVSAFCCGAYLFEGDLCRPLLDALPRSVRLRPSAGSALRVTVDLLVAEMGGSGPGQQALLDRLLDAALVQALREHFASAGEPGLVPGWYAALDDPELSSSLQAMHADPAHAWTVGDLAGHAQLSRAVFARRFTDVVGVPPLQYLTDWRMALARERLRDSGDHLAAIASAVGYSSEFSFAAAFKRREGVAPGRWRALARAA